jgi:hypothetical protein
MMMMTRRNLARLYGMTFQVRRTWRVRSKAMRRRMRGSRLVRDDRMKKNKQGNWEEEVVGFHLVVRT